MCTILETTTLGKLGNIEKCPVITPEVILINTIVGEMTRKEIQDALRLKNSEHFRKHYLLPALGSGIIEMTIPDKPTSRMQKYRLTEKGRELKRQK